MTAAYHVLGVWDVAIAASLLILNAGLSFAFRLGLGRRLLIAGARMVVQLGLVGLVLKALFAANSPWLTLLAASVMVGFAGYEAVARQERRFTGFWSWGIGGGSAGLAAMIVMLFALTTQIKADPWYDPRYAIPILGMVLGNAMNGISLALDRLLSAAETEREAIEARLMLGHDFRTAVSGAVRQAMRAGLIPTINGMAAAGLVSLPGMMTGQILSGVPPTEAVKYQLLIMFLIAGGTAIGVFTLVMAARRLLTDPRDRLRLDRLRAVDGGG